MNPYQWRATCSVCGGLGMGTINAAVGEWRGAFISHRDPRVCAEVLREREERRLAALRQAAAA